MPQKNIIESHNSYLTNKGMAGWFVLIDSLGFSAANTMQFDKIMAYYNSIEQLYLSKAINILPDNSITEIEKIRKFYSKITSLIETNPSIRSRKTIQILLDVTKKYNFLLSNGLQEKEFFFRLSSRQAKGLKNVHFLTNSIFNKGEDIDGRSQEANS